MPEIAWRYDDLRQKYYGEQIDQSLSIQGAVEVSLTGTSQAGVSSTQTDWAFTLEADPPSVSFICESTALHEISCESWSTSGVDSQIVNHTWQINGEEYPGSFVVVNLEPGIHEVILTVTDNFNLTDTSSRMIEVAGNSPPVINGSCFSGAPLTVSCSVIYAFDPDGGEVTTNWHVGDEVIESNFFSKQVQSVNQSIMLVGTDEQGASTSITLSPSIMPGVLNPVASCSQSDADEVTCTGIYSTGTNNTVTGYTWTNSLGDSGTNEEFIFEFDEEEEEIIIELTIENIDGQTQTTQVTFNTQPIEELSLPSLGELMLESPQDGPFYHINEEVIVSVIDEIIDDEGGIIVFINDRAIGPEYYELVDEQAISINAQLNEGQNIIVVRAIDSQQRVLFQEFVIYAGSRNLNISAEDPQQWMQNYNYKLIFASRDMENDPLFISMPSNQKVLLNTPAKRSFIALFPDSPSQLPPTDSLIIDHEENYIVMELDKTNPEPHSNLDFSLGDEGWQLERGIKEITLRDDRGNYFREAREDVETLTLSANIEGDLSVRSLLVVDNPENAGLGWNHELTPHTTEDFFVTFQLNRTIGDVSLQVVDHTDFSNLDGQIRSWSMRAPRIGLDQDVNNLVEVNFIAYTNYVGGQPEFTHRQLIPLILRSAYADDVPTTNLMNIYGAIEFGFMTASNLLLTGNRENDREGIRGLTLGNYMRNPVNGNIMIQGEGELAGQAVNRLRLGINPGTEKFQKLQYLYSEGYQLNLLLCDNPEETSYNLRECYESHTFTLRGNDSYFAVDIPEYEHFLESTGSNRFTREIAEANNYRVHVMFSLANQSTGQIVDFDHPRIHSSLNATKGLRIFALVEPWNSPARMYGAEDPNNNDYNDFNGGDKYVDLQILDVINSLAFHSFTFEEESGETHNLQLRANDFSAINGNSTLGRRGGISRHFFGAGDFRYAEKSEPTITEFIQGNLENNLQPILREQTLRSIVSILDKPISEYILYPSVGFRRNQGVIVTYEEGSLFDRALTYSCTRQGQKAKNYIVTDHNGRRPIHGDHFHIDFIDLRVEKPKDYSAGRAFYSKYESVSKSYIESTSTPGEARYEVKFDNDTISLGSIVQDSNLQVQILVEQELQHESNGRTITEKVFLPLPEDNEFIFIDNGVLVVRRNLAGTEDDFYITPRFKFLITRTTEANKACSLSNSLAGRNIREVSQLLYHHNPVPSSGVTTVISQPIELARSPFSGVSFGDTFHNLTYGNTLSGSIVEVSFPEHLHDQLRVNVLCSGGRSCHLSSSFSGYGLGVTTESVKHDGKLYFLIHPLRENFNVVVENNSGVPDVEFTVSVVEDNWGMHLISLELGSLSTHFHNYNESRKGTGEYCPAPENSPYFVDVPQPLIDSNGIIKTWDVTRYYSVEKSEYPFMETYEIIDTGLIRRGCCVPIEEITFRLRQPTPFMDIFDRQLWRTDNLTFPYGARSCSGDL